MAKPREPLGARVQVGVRDPAVTVVGALARLPREPGLFGAPKALPRNNREIMWLFALLPELPIERQGAPARGRVVPVAPAWYRLNTTMLLEADYHERTWTQPVSRNVCAAINASVTESSRYCVFVGRRERVCLQTSESFVRSRVLYFTMPGGFLRSPRGEKPVIPYQMES